MIINHNILLFILDEFIFEGILSKSVLIENYRSEYKGYGANLIENNDKNDLYYTIKAIDINDLEILNVCIYININKSR